LGVTFDARLSWHRHIADLRPKCYAIIAALRRLRVCGVPTEGLLMVYRSLFLPVIGYGISIWGSGYKGTVHSAQIIQNDALRAMFGRKRSESVSELYALHGLLTISQLTYLSVANMAHRITFDLVAPDIQLQ
jgi:hypothetical protein